MLVARRSGFRLGGRNDGLRALGVGSLRRIPAAVRLPFDFPLREPQDRLRTNGQPRFGLGNGAWCGGTGWGRGLVRVRRGGWVMV